MPVQGIKRAELRDELYMQLIKQSRGNATATAPKAWELLYLCAASMPPSKVCIEIFDCICGLSSADSVHAV